MNTLRPNPQNQLGLRSLKFPESRLPLVLDFASEYGALLQMPWPGGTIELPPDVGASILARMIHSYSFLTYVFGVVECRCNGGAMLP